MSPLELTDTERTNYSILRDCLASPLIARSAPRASPENGRRRKTKSTRKPAISKPSPPSIALETKTSDAEELADFIDYIATEIFAVLPSELRTLSYEAIKRNPPLATTYTPPLPTPIALSLLASIPSSVPDTLSTYNILDLSLTNLSHFLTLIVEHYITSAPPSLQIRQRAAGCEICERDWVPLAYHHLIPREVHGMVVERGWCGEWRLGAVAWVYREWWSVELLLGREDVRRWRGWVGE